MTDEEEHSPPGWKRGGGQLSSVMETRVPGEFFQTKETGASDGSAR